MTAALQYFQNLRGPASDFALGRSNQAFHCASDDPPKARRSLPLKDSNLLSLIMGTTRRIGFFGFDFNFGLGLGLKLGRGRGHGQFAPRRRCNCCIAIIICPGVESSRVGFSYWSATCCRNMAIKAGFGPQNTKLVGSRLGHHGAKIYLLPAKALLSVPRKWMANGFWNGVAIIWDPFERCRMWEPLEGMRKSRKGCKLILLLYIIKTNSLI